MKKRLCVVDDDTAVRESLKKVLVDAGYEVTVAADGVEAHANFNGKPLDLLILDVNMPVRDGWDVLEEVNVQHPHLPVIMITGMYDELETTMIPGVRVLLKKPLEADLLLKTVGTILTETMEGRACSTADR